MTDTEISQWDDYLKSQADFQFNVAGSIDSVYDLIGRPSGSLGNSNES